MVWIYWTEFQCALTNTHSKYQSNVRHGFSSHFLRGIRWKNRYSNQCESERSANKIISKTILFRVITESIVSTHVGRVPSNRFRKNKRQKKKEEKKTTIFTVQHWSPCHRKDEIKCNVHGSCKRKNFISLHRQPTEGDCLIQLLSLL